jgi:lambda family phage portal protein
VYSLSINMAKKIEFNWFERGLAQVAPGLAVTRAMNRARLDIMSIQRERSYDAGRKSRSTAGWEARNGTSANTEVKMDVRWLVGRARDLVRNNPYAKKAVQAITTNVVGTGVRPSMPKNFLTKAQEKQLMKLWRGWGETTDCDYNGQFTFYGLTMQAWRASVESGNSFFRVMREPSGLVPISLQLLEFDFLDLSRDGEVYSNGDFCVAGIVFSPRGKRKAYWMFENHPGDTQNMRGNYMSHQIPADEIIHIYEVLRPGQVIGIPHGVASFLKIKNLDNYEDAQLTRQMIAACFSVFIRKNGDGDDDSDRGDLPGVSEKVTPGMIEYLDPGEDISFASPPGAEGYDPYVKSIIRSIAAAYLLTYETVSGDLSGVNFSSYRAGWLEMHRQFAQWQEFIIKGMCCQPVWKHFFDNARLSGAYRGEYAMAEWTPPRREMIDPVKEAKGFLDLIRAGLSSKAMVIRELGDDPEKVFEEIKDERTEADKNDLMFESDSKYDAARVNFGKDAYLAVKTKAATSQSPEK